MPKIIFDIDNHNDLKVLKVLNFFITGKVKIDVTDVKLVI